MHYTRDIQLLVTESLRTNVRKGSCVEVCTNDVDARETIDLVVVWGRVGAAPEEVVKPEFSVCVFSGEEKIH